MPQVTLRLSILVDGIEKSAETRRPASWWEDKATLDDMVENLLKPTIQDAQRADWEANDV